MQGKTYNYIIVGAGLSGLRIGQLLKSKGVDDFCILESRDRIGGRILTEETIDLGATWFQEHHQNLSQLVREIPISKFPQRTQGTSVLVYNSMAPAHHFESDPNAPAAYRLAGGSQTLIAALAKDIQEHIHCNESVHSITTLPNGLEIATAGNVYRAQRLILAIPPQLAAAIHYSPALPMNVRKAMEETHTWMSNAIKVGLTFKNPFWRDKGYSGTIIGQIGPTIELYDHANYEDSTYALMGFVNEGLRDESPENRKERILGYLEKHLGAEIRNFKTYLEKDWSQDPHTSAANLKSVYISPRYGNPLLRNSLMDGKLLLSVAEVSPIHGGYMDGAIYRANEVVELLLNE